MSSSLLEHLASYAQAQIGVGLESGHSRDLRVSMSGVPRALAEGLFTKLSAPGQGISVELGEQTIQVPVYLVDPAAVDPVDGFESCRCSPSFVLKVRNSGPPIYLVLRCEDDPSNQSLDTTWIEIGPRPRITQLERWLQQPLIAETHRFSVDRLFPGEAVPDGAQRAVHTLIEEAWANDEGKAHPTEVWSVFERLCSWALHCDSRAQSLSACLGLPNCSPNELGTKAHLDVVSRLAELVETNGFRATFELLQENADDELREHLTSLQDHIKSQCRDSTEFVRRPHEHYRPVSDADAEVLPRWWLALDVDAWARILDSSSEPDEHPDIRVSCGNLLAPQSGTRPGVVSAEPELSISISSLPGEDPVEIEILRASGNAQLSSIGRVNISSMDETVSWVDEEPPAHDRFVRYELRSSDCSPAKLKLIVLSDYGVGVVAHSRGAKKAKAFKLNRKARAADRSRVERLECSMHLDGMGLHQIDFYYSPGVSLSECAVGRDIDSEGTTSENPINSVGEGHSVCWIETDDECTYDFSIKRPSDEEELPCRIEVSADERAPTEAGTEFDRLIVEHRSSVRAGSANARVEPTTSRVVDLETWSISSDCSYLPLILGPDFLDIWHEPDWTGERLISDLQLLVDPRPSREDLSPPDAFLEAYQSVLRFLQPEGDDEVVPVSAAKLGVLMKDSEFAEVVVQYVRSYSDWLAANYEAAIWCHTVSLHQVQPSNSLLEQVPYAVLLSPLHPIRFGWQCSAQKSLQGALEAHDRCPAASMLSSSAFPESMILHCMRASGRTSPFQFSAVESSSDYWGVLWSTQEIGKVGAVGEESAFGWELGIQIEGLTTGFSEQQVVRSLTEIDRMLSARSTLRVEISSDTGGESGCNAGISQWAEARLGPTEDHWFSSGARSLIVSDARDQSTQPEQAALASLTERTGAAVRWFRRGAEADAVEQDLSIVAHLGSGSSTFEAHRLRSAIDRSCLTRWRIRKQLPVGGGVFIAESRIGRQADAVDEDDLPLAIHQAVDEVESACRDHADALVFAPNVDTLRRAIERSSYAAVSSANIDAACFFGPAAEAILWDYELPSYARRSGENGGYYLFANQSPLLRRAFGSAAESISGGAGLPKERISELLEEVSRRGMPTLKRLTAGGSVSVGEIGMLVALRVLQVEFEGAGQGGSLIPAFNQESSIINLVVPVDPFQFQTNDLRRAIDGTPGERPDLIVISIRFDESGRAVAIRITPIEVKARGSSIMSRADRVSALAQAKSFSDFLRRLMTRAADSVVWGVAWRSLLVSLIDYGFRVYGQLSQFSEQGDEWSGRHESVVHRVAGGEIPIDLDLRGRLIVMDGSALSDTVDLDGDGFEESLSLCQSDASSILAETRASILDAFEGSVGSWELEADIASPIEETKPIDHPDLKDDSPRSDGPEPADLTESGGDVSGSVVSVSEQQVEPSEIPLEADAVQEGAGRSSAGPSASASDATDHSGIEFVVGETVGSLTKREVTFYPGSTELNQLNVGVVGDLGTGKTQLLQALVYQLVRDPETNRGVRPNVLIFDYKKDYSKREFVEATGAKVVEPYNIPLNVFDTRNSSQRRNAWLERSKFFSDVLDKLYSGIGPAQRQKIKDAVREGYRAAEFSGQGCPTIYDVFAVYSGQAGDRYDSPRSIMSDIVDGEYFVRSQSDVVPFSEFLDGVVVIDLAEVGQDDRTKNMLVVVLLNLFYEHMLKIEKRPFLGHDPQLRFVDTMLLVDEADNIMKHEFDVLKKVLLQGREFGVGVILASQYLSHFKTRHENYLEPLLTWFVHKVPNLTVRELEEIGLPRVDGELVERVKSLECHACLTKTLDATGEIMRGTPFFELDAGA